MPRSHLGYTKLELGEAAVMRLLEKAISGSHNPTPSAERTAVLTPLPG